MIRQNTVVALLLSCLLLVCGAAVAEPPLDNAGVVSLVGLGLGDDVVLAKIRQAPAVAFAIGAEDLKALKAKGVSSAVMTAMIDRAGRPSVVGATSDSAPRGPAPWVLVQPARRRGFHCIPGGDGLGHRGDC